MNKRAQSLLDFINYMPLQAIEYQKAMLSGKEAECLYNLFKNADRDEYGNIKVSNEFDTHTLTALTTKGIIESDTSALKLFSPQKSIKITSKGKEVIKKLILNNEKSTFSKGLKTASSNGWHYEY